MKLATGSNYNNAMTRRNLEALLFEIQVEIYRQAVIKMAPAIEKIGDDFIKDVISIAHSGPSGYSGFKKAFTYAMNRISRPKVHIAQPAASAFNISRGAAHVIRLRLVQWSVAELDKQTRQEVKRSFLTGQKIRFNTSGTHPGLGWWYYFENGTADRNWGSKRFAFLPGLNGGGRMVPMESLANPRGLASLNDDVRRVAGHVGLSKKTTAGQLNNLTNPDNDDLSKKEAKAADKILSDESLLRQVKNLNKRSNNIARAIARNKSHPGVFKIAMFAKAFKNQNQTLETKIRTIFKAALDSISKKDIELAVQRVKARRGLATGKANDPYVSILNANRAAYPSVKPPTLKAEKAQIEHSKRVDNYNALQNLYKRIGAV